MIGRIIAYIMFGCMTIALVLSFVGIREVYLGDGFQNWLRYVNNSLSSWSLEIPKIPDIPLIQQGDEVRSHLRLARVVTVPVANPSNFGKNILNILNLIIMFFNFIIQLLNIFITLVNILIKIIQFILTMVWCIKDIPEYLNSNNWLRWNNESTIWWWPYVGL